VTNSNRRRAGGKPPQKPRPDFPLNIHKGTGYWCKKIRGRVHYFGSVADDPKGVAALEEYLRDKDDLQAGREPRRKTDGLTIAELCNQFLAEKESKRDTGELNPRTFWGYHATCEGVVKAFRKDRAVTDLVPDDFRKLRKELSKTRGAVALGNEIMRVRSIFKFAFDEGLILAPIKFGQAFGKPKSEVVARAREAHRLEHGVRMFEANEIRAILAACGQPLKAMVLLGANCGFGQTDLSSLPSKAVDLDSGWVDFARVKTGVARRIPLWPETVAAIREWLPLRPKAKDPADAKLLFLTCRGARWVKLSKGGKKKKDGTLTQPGAPADALGQEFGKVIRLLKLDRSRRSFYALRHGFETVAGETADQIVVDVIMGHKVKGMAANYIERIGDDRRRRVVEHVRAWLFTEAPTDGTPGSDKNFVPRISDPIDPCDPPQRDKSNDAGPQGSQGSQNREPDAGPVLRLYAG
jgi:integrase